jgi:hypothetical protein
MRRSTLLLTLISGVYFLSGCGGSGASGAGNTPSPVVAANFSVTAPAAAMSGAAFSFTVTAMDATNNVATSYSGTVHFSSTDGQAILPANSTLAGGTGMFSATLETAGAQTITAIDMAKTTLTGVTNPISVSLTAAKFTVTAPEAVTAGTAFTFNITALDNSGSTFAGYTGTVSFASTDGQAALPANSTLTNGTGTFSGTLKTDGNQTITATDAATASIADSASVFRDKKKLKTLPQQV